MWYNISNIRREGRVLAQYLMGPLRYVIWIVFSAFIGGGDALVFIPFLLIAALIPFSTSYGLSFAGYELAYEGKNLMNLQLAAANMIDYIKGKVYSAVPFSLGACIVMCVIMVVSSLESLIYIPVLVLCIPFVTLMAGGMAANAASIGGDFKAERQITRQRGANVRMPIRGIGSMIRASIIPNIIAYIGVFSVIFVGVLFGPWFSYIGAALFIMICYSLFRNYVNSAGRRLKEIEATESL
jgi:hypothetical protein